MEYQLSDRPEREKTKRGDFAPARPKNKSQWEDRDLPFWPSTTWESEQACPSWWTAHFGAMGPSLSPDGWVHR